MKDKIILAVKDAVCAVQQLEKDVSLEFIEKAAGLIADTFLDGKKIIIAGNGGSLCDAQHFAEELTGFFRKSRRPFPAIALSDPGHITCVANDLGFDWVFSRGVEAYGEVGDVFIGLTTSGNSENIINAFEAAKKIGLKTIAFLGKKGGRLKGFADLELDIESFETSDRIQEAHMTAIHIIIEIVEVLINQESKTLNEKACVNSLVFN